MPIILSEGKYTQSDVEQLKQGRIWKITDVYIQQLNELYEVENPNKVLDADVESQKKSFIQQKIDSNPQNYGNWIYFPWNGCLIHAVNEADYFKLRTTRNKLLVSDEEQKVAYDFTVGILGLSIGGNMAVSLAYSGFAKSMKLGEFDTIDTTNLNRIHTSVSEIGTKKSDITARRIYEINPYADLDFYGDGVNEQNLKSFLSLDPVPKVIFEAIDDFEMKVRVRVAAKEHRIPVVMLTNLGDSLLIDIERYDQEDDLTPFNGLAGNSVEEILSNPITEREKVRYAITLVGKEHLSNRILKTLFEINKSVSGRPQLNSTVTIGSGFASMIVRKLALNQALPSGRYFLNLDTIINSSTTSDDFLEREVLLNKLTEMVGII